MAEAFKALDAHFWAVARHAQGESPDEALDWVFMMHTDDWQLLHEAWPTRPPAWREECAYILGEAPFANARGLLELAIFDPDGSVAV